MLKVFLQVVLRIKEETEVFWLKMFGKLEKSVKDDVEKSSIYIMCLLFVHTKLFFG
jgi:hypothetical protein